MHRRSSRLLAVAFAALGTGVTGLGISVAWADGNAGFAAYESGDYATAMKEFMPMAAGGHHAAQYAVGVMYLEGQGVPKNPAEAVKWLTPAAESGVAAAQDRLGHLYLMGDGVPQDVAQAAKWLQLAADRGVVTSQVRISGMYYQGVGVAQDKVKAYLYAGLAAIKHSEEGEALVGYLQGQLTPAELSQAEALIVAWKPVVPQL